MRNFVSTLAALAVAACLVVPAHGAEATFSRTLTINGPVDLTVISGAGSIHLLRGDGNSVQIRGRVRSGWGPGADSVQSIADQPPIEQTGNIIRIGMRHSNWRNISIDYEIEAPANTYVNAGTGSGKITDDGVGMNVKLHTGSGSIRATGLQGSCAYSTGSGSIYAEQGGPGDLSAGTGSGSIDLHNVHGGLRVSTGSGSIMAEGAPTASWRISTGSGSIELWTGSTPFTLDAATGSGGVTINREIVQEGKPGHHHVQGRVSGGGVLVYLRTGSGRVRVH